MLNKNYQNMKYWFLSLAMSAIVSIGFAQQFEQPKEGAEIRLSSYEIDLNASDEAKLDIWVVRSKKAKKSKFDAPKLLGSADLEIAIVQDPNDQDHYVATVKAENVENGTYFYTVSSRSRSIQKVKGTTVSFNVGATTAVTKNRSTMKKYGIRIGSGVLVFLF